MSDEQVKQLEKLHALLEKQAITQTEYEQKKQQILNTQPHTTPQTSTLKTVLAIISVALGVIMLLMYLGNGLWTLDMLIGLIFFAVIGLVCGLFALKGQTPKSPIALTGVVLNSITILFALFTDYIAT